MSTHSAAARRLSHSNETASVAAPSVATWRAATGQLQSNRHGAYLTAKALVRDLRGTMVQVINTVDSSEVDKHDVAAVNKAENRPM